MKYQMKHQIHVGNIGCVIDTDSEDEALKCFAEYYHQSLSGAGRAGDESVHWWYDPGSGSEPVFEFFGVLDTTSEEFRPAYEIVDHGIDHSQYFRGCGVFYTKFDHCATGSGFDFHEALNDALEQVASGISGDRSRARFKVIEACAEHECAHVAKDAGSVYAHLEKQGELTEDGDVPEDSELYYYLSIRF